MRLIDADALKADYGMAEDCKDCKTGYRSCQYDNTYTKMDFCGWIDDAPTVDAVPVRHGRWTIEDCHAATYRYCCSNCTAHHRARYAYCPSCGAVMDGKDGEQHG